MNMAQTKIEYCDTVWNPVVGCSKVSPGCAHCYAEKMAWRLKNAAFAPGANESLLKYVDVVDHGHWNGQVRVDEKKLEEPLRWRKPRRIFVNSMGDLFHPDVPESFISAVFYVMQKAKQHIFLVLTKRPERMAEFIDHQVHCDNAYPDHAWRIGADSTAGRPFGYGHYRREEKQRPPLPNVWLGVTAENQQAADERIPILLQIPAAVRFVSVEPMLGLVDLRDYLRPKTKTAFYNRGGRGRAMEVVIRKEHLNWVICGGETGPNARPCHPDWVRSLRDQCQAAGVPFFFKSWGEYKPLPFSDREDGLHTLQEYPGCKYDFVKVGKKEAGRLLDGRTWDEFPVMPGA